LAGIGSVYAVHSVKEALDFFDKGFVGGSSTELQWLDHERVHGTGVVGLNHGEPIAHG
jgi:hypothetical protein